MFLFVGLAKDKRYVDEGRYLSPFKVIGSTPTYKLIFWYKDKKYSDGYLCIIQKAKAKDKSKQDAKDITMRRLMNQDELDDLKFNEEDAPPAIGWMKDELRKDGYRLNTIWDNMLLSYKEYRRIDKIYEDNKRYTNVFSVEFWDYQLNRLDEGIIYQALNQPNDFNPDESHPHPVKIEMTAKRYI